MRNAWLAATVCALCAMPCSVFAEEHEGAHEHAEHEHEEEARLHVGLDFVLGLGRPRTEEVSTGPAEVNVEEPKPPVVESFLLAASYEVAEHFAVGARFGVSLGDVMTPDGSKSMTSAFTNLELEGEYETELGEHTSLAISVGVSLPTAQGLASEDAGLESAVRRRIVQEAAAAARGFEDGALFEPGYLGLIPKIALEHHAGALVLEGFLKYESLVQVADTEGKDYIGELIPGGFIGYELAKIVTLGLRAWGTVAFQELKESAFIIEPQARAQLGPVRLVLGALVPVASRFEEPTLIGLRLTAAARF